MNDLLVSLNHNKYNRVVSDLEERVNVLFQSRHMHPIWPEHNDQLDAYELEIHAPIRRIYYQSTIVLVGALRAMKNLHNY